MNASHEGAEATGPVPSGSSEQDLRAEPSDCPAIRVRNLWQRFGPVNVLQDVSFTVSRGEIFGLIGPKGAGKTTTIRILATLLEATLGRVEIEGIDVDRDPEKVRRLIGYMADRSGVYSRISVLEYLSFFAHANGVSEERTRDVMDLTGFSRERDSLVGSLSQSLRRRLQLARALLNDPRVLLLDEPASDLDPHARIEMRDLLLRLQRVGKTVFFTSDILTELSDICTSVAVIEAGRLLDVGSIPQLAERLMQRPSADAPTPESLQHPEPRPLRGDRALDGPTPAERHLQRRVLRDAAAALPRVEAITGVVGAELLGKGRIRVRYLGDERFVTRLVQQLVDQGIPLVSVEPERNELERIFRSVTGGDRP